jgi:hypothetical protein
VFGLENVDENEMEKLGGKRSAVKSMKTATANEKVQQFDVCQSRNFAMENCLENSVLICDEDTRK